MVYHLRVRYAGAAMLMAQALTRELHGSRLLGGLECCVARLALQMDSYRQWDLQSR